MTSVNDDGIPLNLRFVFILFAMPNCIFLFLTILNAYMIYLSKKRPRLDAFLGELANFFSNGALDRIIRNMLKHFEAMKQLQQQETLLTRKRSYPENNSIAMTTNFNYPKIYDTNYLFLIPFQIDLLLTVFVYKILTRDVYQETCQSYLKTFHTRPKQVVCWLKNTNLNVSNLSINVSLEHYCLNQTITYINYEHNDVVCVHYVFKLINIVDTVTNIFAWHQAVVFIVTKSIVFCYWYQHKLRKTSFCVRLLKCHRRIISSIILICVLIIYILVFIFIIPIWFFLFERRRVDLTRHLLYACSKFITAAILHVNLYVLYQWHSLNLQKKSLLKPNEKNDLAVPINDHQQELVKAIANEDYDSSRSVTMMEYGLDTSSKKYFTSSTLF